MYMEDQDNTSRVEWGKEFKWGIVKRVMRSYVRTVDDQRKPLLEYYVVEHAQAVFTGPERCVASNLTHEEASAMCAILNAGSSR